MFRSYVYRIAAALVFVLLTAGTAAGDAARFPVLTARNLNGRSLTLPRDFAGRENLVFVAFERKQQAEVDSWSAAVAALRARRPELGAYELPTLSRGLSLMRGFIDGGMRRGIPDEDVRATTITLYIDKGSFKAALGITTESEITVLLVRSDGTILWRASGPYRDGALSGVDEALAADPGP